MIFNSMLINSMYDIYVDMRVCVSRIATPKRQLKLFDSSWIQLKFHPYCSGYFYDNHDRGSVFLSEMIAISQHLRV